MAYAKQCQVPESHHAPLHLSCMHGTCLAGGLSSPDMTCTLISHAGTEMTTAVPLLTPFDRKKAAAIGLRKWVRFASDGETTIMQVWHGLEDRADHRAL